MPKNRKTTATIGRPFIGLCCPQCEYNLTGTTEPRCPECGEAFDPAKLRPPMSWWRGRPSWWVALALVLLVVYLPNTWIFWVDYSWQGGYRMYWVKMFPMMPSLTPMYWVLYSTGLAYTIDEADGYLICGVVTAIMIVACFQIGGHSRRWLLAICIAMFVFQVFNALGSYALFRG